MVVGLFKLSDLTAAMKIWKKSFEGEDDYRRYEVFGGDVKYPAR